MLIGCTGVADVGSKSWDTVPIPVESVKGIGATEREVKAFSGSERLSEKEAFSAHMAHWSRERAQYFPCLAVAAPFATVVSRPVITVDIDKFTEDFKSDAMRKSTLRMARALISGRRKSKNS